MVDGMAISKFYGTDAWPKCVEDHCGRPVHTKKSGLCQSHYLRARKGAAPGTIRPRLVDMAVVPKCSVPWCAKTSNTGLVLCTNHQRIASGYSLNPSVYAEMVANGCQICGRPGVVSIDHDHACCPSPKTSCGECVRGPLCGGCNYIVGWVEASELVVQALVAGLVSYMEDSRG